MVTMFSVVCFIMEICNSGKVGELRQTVNLFLRVSRFESYVLHNMLNKNKEVWQSLVYCNGLENRRTERFREFESHRFHHK